MINTETDKAIKSGIIAFAAVMLLFAFGCEKTHAGKASDNMVFLGDSITESYDLERYFPDFPIINSGVWGDRTDQAQARLESDVYAYKPKKVFMLLGINDVGYGRTNEDIAERIGKIIEAIQENCPYSEVYLISVYPLNISDFDVWYPPMSKDINDIVDDLNERLFGLTDELGAKYIDMAPYLKNDAGELKKEYTVEGLHLTDAAYEVISGVMKQYMN